MADIQETKIIDDLTGKVLDPAEFNRIEFTVDGKSYRLDVDEKGRAKFEKAMNGFIEHATRVHRKYTKRKGRKPSVSTGEQTRMREWAQANGLEVAARGRIPAVVVEAYQAAQNTGAEVSES